MDIVGPNYDFKHREYIEEVILGCILLDNVKAGKNYVFTEQKIDSIKYFSTEIHKGIFEAILNCWEKNIPVDLITLVHNRPQRYRNNSIQNEYINFEFYSINAMNKIGSAIHIEHHILFLKQYILMDYWNSKANDIKSKNWDVRDVLVVSDNIINGYNTLFSDLNENIIKDNSSSVVDEAQKRFDRVQSGQKVGVKIGINNIDQKIDGFMPGDLQILGARPSMGKTSIALRIAANVAFEHNIEVDFISLEMTKIQIYNKLIAPKINVPFDMIRKMQLSKEQFEALKSWYIYLDNSKLNVIDASSSITKNLLSIVNYTMSSKSELFILDYLQLASLSGGTKKMAGNREQEVSEISRSLKLLALKKNIPVLALSQLSRKCEERPNKRPILSDLRESGSLEQDADNIFFAYRQAYYDKMSGKHVPPIEEGNIEIIQAKGRETGTDVYKNHIDFSTNYIGEGFKFNDNKNINNPV
jgi:replicative DNA helicase